MTREYTAEEHREWLAGLPAIPAGAIMLLEDEAGRLLVVKANYRSYWSPPGGVVDAGESPKNAAVRETKEEVGLTIQPQAVEFAGVAHLKSEKFTNIYHFIFKAKLTSEQSKTVALRKSEIEAYDFITKDEARDGSRVYSPPVINWANDSIFLYDEQATP